MATGFQPVSPAALLLGSNPARCDNHSTMDDPLDAFIYRFTYDIEQILTGTGQYIHRG
jgi:hypothetical protein